MAPAARILFIFWTSQMQGSKSSHHNHYSRHGSSTALHQPKPSFQRKRDNDDVKSTNGLKDHRLRQNYIINRDNVYTKMEGQFDQLANKPDFNRFISLKKTPSTKNQTIYIIAKEIVRSHEDKRRNTGPKNRLRQRILFQKMRRPEYNSPIKRTIQELDTESTRTIEEGKQRPRASRVALTSIDCEEDNSMMLKQLVTRLEDSRGMKKMQSTPYAPHKKEKYYVAESIKGYLDRESAVRDHLFNSIYFLELLVSYNNTTQYSQDKPINLPQHPKFKDKITVVFDLDETLVHCFEELTEKHQVQIPVTFPGGHSMLAPVNVRPYAKEVLQELGKEFQLMVFTASHEAYANAVINFLDPKRQLIQHRLYRRHCDYIDQGYYVKDLRILGRDLSRVVIVDNAAYSYAFQVSNGIPIISYYQGQSDFQLKALRDYLFELKSCKDVREYNEATFKLSKYTTYTNVEDLVEELYIEK